MRQNTGKIQVEQTIELTEALMLVLGEKPRPMAICEIGTMHGDGSTMLVIQAVEQMMKDRPRLKKMPKFWTIEASYKNYTTAKSNLKKYKWVEVIHGLSIGREEAIQFINTDDAIREHEKYPDLIIDNPDPIPFYTKEIRGQLFGEGPEGEENVLQRLMPDLWDQRPLFIMDGCGGTGYLEFQKVVEWMGEGRYYMFLDDINHLKNWRSALYIKSAKWPIIVENDRWLLALHPGAPGKSK